MKDSINNGYKRKVENKVRAIKNSDLSRKNKQLILGFQDKCFAEGIGIKRILKYLANLHNIAKWLGKDLDKTTREDIEKVVAKIEKSDYADWTKHDYKVALKKYYKVMEGNDEGDYPKKVKWVKTTVKGNGKKLPDELLSQEDVKKLIEVTVKARDRALVSVLYESGCRIGELLGMDIRHIILGDSVAHIMLSGKTGSRKIPLVTSVPYLSNWLNHHPEKDNPSSPLWVGFADLGGDKTKKTKKERVKSRTKRHSGRLGYATVRGLLIELSEKAGIKKAVNPHIFRHSRATHLANHLTEAQMKEYFGWVQGSEMASIYVHLSGRDVDNAILEIHGLRKPEAKEEAEELSPVNCQRCGQSNEATAKYCQKCGLPMDIRAQMDFTKKKEAFSKVIQTKDIKDRILEELKEEIRKEIREALDKK